MLALVPGAASLIGKVGGRLIANKKDPERVAKAQAWLQQALAGDKTALANLQAQATGSATEVGKEAARRALEAYNASSATFIHPETSTPLQDQVKTTVDSVRNDLATGIQRIGAGATSAAANALGTKDDRFTLPLSVPITSTQMILLAAVAAGVILLARRR
jgi:hypothetical protein